MPEYFATKYDSAAAEIIAMLADETEGYGQRDDTTGEADAPTGYVSLVVIPADVDLFVRQDDIEQTALDYGVTPAEVAGVHIVTHNSQGFVDVTTYETEAEAREAFAEIDRAYTRYVYGVPDSVPDSELDDYIAANPDPDGFI